MRDFISLTQDVTIIDMYPILFDITSFSLELYEIEKFNIIGVATNATGEKDKILF